MHRQGFTLIELLIVVAIIAILAAIAVPNFLEAQTRSKITRVKSDMRAVATGLEAYRVDNRSYVSGYVGYSSDNGSIGGGWLAGENLPPPSIPIGSQLTTPISYLSSMPVDPFMTTMLNRSFPAVRIASFMYVTATGDPNAAYDPCVTHQWTVYLRDVGYTLQSPGPNLSMSAWIAPADREAFYDPTNGTLSPGDLWWAGLGRGPDLRGACHQNF